MSDINKLKKLAEDQAKKTLKAPKGKVFEITNIKDFFAGKNGKN